jgi:hypothetical protein
VNVKNADMVGNLLAPEIKSMIDARNFGALREVFRDWIHAMAFGELR